MEANMKKLLIAAMIAVSTIAAAQTATAIEVVVPRVPPPAPKGPAAGTHGVGVLPQYVFFATSCSALFLWLQALHVSQTQHRELTQKEAWTTVGNCFVPIVGGAVMGSLAQQP
jgi:opacity protein-like surface antigen